MTPPKLTTKLARRHRASGKAAGVGGAIGTILLGLGAHLGIHPSPVEAGAFVTLVGYGASFLPAPRS